ncbi:ComF family protein [Bacteroides sp. 224]|uniref:ComF family protein n=1 Tax=Bacteroides sp. 224 TaxID=2302936 RepID=UPI0013D63585|nr:ComF family protein [Bacteroides sp. 224]NDV65681.1 ComF family protein [Bacteroides sp. 224]
MKKWIHAFFTLFFPPCCIVCNRPLSESEEYMCLKCNMGLPRTNYHLYKDNYVEKMFWGRIPIQRATAFFFYQKGSEYNQLLHQLKYKGYKEIGEAIGRVLATEIQSSGDFFHSIDVVIPIPLHSRKKKKRGYNQSEWIAKGISNITGIPMDTVSVVREKDTDTQTRKSRMARWENVEGIFRLIDPDGFQGKHVLLVDDVLTTGATMEACAEVFNEVSGVRVSVLGVGLARD